MRFVSLQDTAGMESKAKDAEGAQDLELGQRVANLMKFAAAAVEQDSGVVQEGPATTQDVILELLRRPNTVDFQKLLEAIPRSSGVSTEPSAIPDSTGPIPTEPGSAKAAQPPSQPAPNPIPAAASVKTAQPLPPPDQTAPTIPAEPKQPAVAKPIAPGPKASAVNEVPAMMPPPSGPPARRAASVEHLAPVEAARSMSCDSLLDSSDAGSGEEMDEQRVLET